MVDSQVLAYHERLLTKELSQLLVPIMQSDDQTVIGVLRLLNKVSFDGTSCGVPFDETDQQDAVAVSRVLAENTLSEAAYKVVSERSALYARNLSARETSGPSEVHLQVADASGGGAGGHRGPVDMCADENDSADAGDEQQDLRL